MRRGSGNQDIEKGYVWYDGKEEWLFSGSALRNSRQIINHYLFTDLTPTAPHSQNPQPKLQQTPPHILLFLPPLPKSPKPCPPSVYLQFLTGGLSQPPPYPPTSSSIIKDLRDRPAWPFDTRREVCILGLFTARFQNNSSFLFDERGYVGRLGRGAG